MFNYRFYFLFNYELNELNEFFGIEFGVAGSPNGTNVWRAWGQKRRTASLAGEQKKP